LGLWVYEKDIKNGDGTELQPKRVGLKKKHVYEKLTEEFQAYLVSKQDWSDQLVNFRDALAHLIPLYIPPYVVPKANAVKYNELEKKKWEEPAKSDPVAFEKLKMEQLKLCQFVPGMMHSIFEGSPQVEFHSQLLNDYVTIDEYGLHFLKSLTVSRS